MFHVLFFLLSLSSSYSQKIMPEEDVFDPKCTDMCEMKMKTVLSFAKKPQGYFYPPGVETASAKHAFLAEEGRYDFDLLPTDIFQCLDLLCICNFLEGQMRNQECLLPNGIVWRKAIRKEYRTLTKKGRRRFHAVMNQLKKEGDYDSLAALHSSMDTMSGAHAGPSFLPWHREYLKRLEILMRLTDPEVSLPYWDSTMDETLPKPGESMVFGEKFLGQSNPYAGFLVSGPFREWFTRQCRLKSKHESFESMHTKVHEYVGGSSWDSKDGDMRQFETAPNDPTFFLLHSYNDMVWEQWRLKHQNRKERETNFATDDASCTSMWHFGGQPMIPFEPLWNLDGLSNKYTDELYEYDEPPQCPKCGNSRYLFCDKKHWRCVSKVRIGGNCTGLPSYACDPDRHGQCIEGICKTNDTWIDEPVRYAKPQIVLEQDMCFNFNPCCSTWATNGECTKNPNYMKNWCQPSCRHCTPDYNVTSTECLDRHQHCGRWHKEGQCKRHPLFMSENCRKSCGLCKKTREQECREKQKREHPCKSDTKGCYNEHECCQIWALNKECRKNRSFMGCNCRVSCGLCNPEYTYGCSQDLHPKCRKHDVSECDSNPWMRENCRKKCKICPTMFELRKKCGTLSSFFQASQKHTYTSHTETVV